MSEVLVWQEDCPGRLVVRAAGDGLEVTCWVDEEPPPEVNLVQNGDFAQGADYWQLNPLTAATFVVAGGMAGVTVTAAAKVVQLYQAGIRLEPGRSYILTFQARADEARALEVAVHQHGAPFTDYGLRAAVAVTNVWQAFALGFEARGMTAQVEDARLRLTVRNATAGHWYEFDDVRLVGVS